MLPLFAWLSTETGDYHQAQTDFVTSCHLYFWGPIHLFLKPSPFPCLCEESLSASKSHWVGGVPFSFMCCSVLVINLCTVPSLNVLLVGSTNLQRVKGQSSLSPNTIKISILQARARTLAPRSQGYQSGWSRIQTPHYVTTWLPAGLCGSKYINLAPHLWKVCCVYTVGPLLVQV